MSYKRLIPCIFLQEGKAVTWFHDETILAENPVKLTRDYERAGADALLIFDLSKTNHEHEENVEMIRRIKRTVHVPIIAGGSVDKQEDVKKLLYIGVKRVMLNLSKPDAEELLSECSERFGKDKIAVSIDDFDTLFKHKKKVAEYASEVFCMHRLDLNSVTSIIDLPFIILTETKREEEITNILLHDGVKGLSGKFISDPERDLNEFKKQCEEAGIEIACFESMMNFSEFKLNSDGLLPVVVQNYKTQEVLMVAYMNEEAFENTIKTGLMTYYSRSRQSLWLKGETSGHFQHVRSLTIDCDKDTLLAKVDQIGAACHTGSPTCFFQPVVGAKMDDRNPHEVFETLYSIIEDRKENPKEGSYTNYLMEKGLDKMLKMFGEKATEVVIGAKNPNPDDMKSALSDLLYHVMVLMVEKGITLEDITNELADR